METKPNLKTPQYPWMSIHRVLSMLVTMGCVPGLHTPSSWHPAPFLPHVPGAVMDSSGLEGWSPFCVVSSQPAQKTLIPRESPWRAWAEAGALHPSASTWILGSLGKKNHSPLHFLTGAAGKWQRTCTYGQPVSNLGTLLNAVHKKRAF